MDKKLFECKICGLKYKYRSNLSAHKKSHTGETQCRICKRNLSTIQMLQTHLALVHRENFKNIGTDIDHYVCREKYTCYVCEEIFNDSATLTKHHLDLHTSAAFTTKSQSDHPHNCPVCQAKFKYSRNLKEHIKSHTGLTKCLGCDKSLSSRANLRRHLLMLHTRDLQCLICNREFEADRLQIHMCTSHSIGMGTRLICCYCSQTFTNKNTLARHNAAKHQAQKFGFQCSTCSTYFKTKWSLATHNSKYHKDHL